MAAVQTHQSPLPYPPPVNPQGFPKGKTRSFACGRALTTGEDGDGKGGGGGETGGRGGELIVCLLVA